MSKVSKKDLQVTDFSQPPDFPALEEKIADYWDGEQIFQQTLDQTKNGDEYVFYDGPPFATGLPHYGHLIASTTKDAFPRYQTMRGRHVERIWGWDCHGLPIENIIEKEQNLNSRAQIEEHGVDNFCEDCRARVQTYAHDWQKTIRRLGRFVDMEHAYKTMDVGFMDKVWGVFGQLWDKGLIYQDYKVMYYCPRCATPLSNFEVTQGYKEVTDISVYVKFKLSAPADLGIESPAYFVAWTTTPWTLPGNALLAVGRDIHYALVQKDGEILILAENKVSELFPDGDYTIIKVLAGTELVGRPYEPVFDYFAGMANAFHVAEADFVDDQEGTGIVHVAPAYGEDDFKLGRREGVEVHHHVDEAGKFTSEVTDWAGAEVKPMDNPQQVDIEIIKYLAAHGSLLAKKKIKHSYPHCWRCDHALLNYATSSFFVRVTELKDELIANNQKINWLPVHFREGRFGDWLANVRDWAISRNRYWGTPLPLWQTQAGEFMCVHSRAELEELTGQKVPDLHKHKIDGMTITKDGQVYRRVPQVLDCWFESGSMPYALGQFPADFISEGQDQTRGWFYTLHVLSCALKNEPAFRNVLVSGIVLAADGKKMSKKLKNYPDPAHIFDAYGADALRLYLMTSPVMKAESLNFDENEVARLRRQVNVMAWNCFVFWRQTGASLQPWPDFTDEKLHILDKYLRVATEKLVATVTAGFDSYHIIDAGRALIDFVDDLSTFYVRLSRERLKTDGLAQASLGQALYTWALLAAPIMPFFSELLYTNLGGKKTSVHLEKWPEYETSIDEQALMTGQVLKEVLAAGQAARRAAKLKVRQPLASAKISAQREKIELLGEVETVIKDELNVKKCEFENVDSQEITVEFDQNLTSELIAEGQAREIMRDIARARKAAGLQPGDEFELAVAQVPAGWREIIEQKTCTKLVENTDV
ncbi:isoleucine--tRNA ligase [bacterium]|nr:isoleucine--tRNA ligase [bacterium]